MNYTIVIGLISTLFMASCSNNQPILDTNKKLSYQFGQPKRQLIAKNQANHLGRPTLNDLDNNTQRYYYSANGNICRKLSSQQTACYINNHWYEAKPVMSSSR